MTSQTVPTSEQQTAAVQPEWLRLGLTTVVLLCCGILLSTRMVEPDLWGHIQYGEDWLFNGALPRTATHTYTAEGHPWINHENLFELAVAVGHRIVGGPGLMILKTMAGLVLMLVMLRRSVRLGVPLVSAAVCLLPAAACLAEFWLLRPQLFSFLLFAAQLLLTERAFAGWQNGAAPRYSLLWLCLPLLAVWTNSHGGVLAGLCVFLALLGLRTCEAFLRRRADAIRVAGHLALLSGLAVGMLFVNPYGWELPYWLAVSLSQPRPEVSEWAGLLDGGPASILFVMLGVLSIFAVKYTKRQRDLAELILVGVVAVQAPGHIRHLAFFALMFGLRLPEHFVSACDAVFPKRTPRPLQGPGAWVVQAELGLILAGLMAVLIHRHVQFGVDRSEYPVDAVEFMDRHRLQGKLAATFDWAQYSLAALTPATTLGFDGRYDTCYPQRVVDMHFDFLFGKDWQRRHRGPDSGPIDPERVLNEGQPDLVLLNRRSDLPAVRQMSVHPDWSVLYQDGLAVIYGRREVFDNFDSPRHFPKELRRASELRPQGIATWPGFPHRTGRDAFSPRRAAEVQQRGMLRMSRR
jgi:hypothetical protein